MYGQPSELRSPPHFWREGQGCWRSGEIPRAWWPVPRHLVPAGPPCCPQTGPQGNPPSVGLRSDHQTLRSAPRYCRGVVGRRAHKGSPLRSSYGATCRSLVGAKVRVAGTDQGGEDAGLEEAVVEATKEITLEQRPDPVGEGRAPLDLAATRPPTRTAGRLSGL